MLARESADSDLPHIELWPLTSAVNPVVFYLFVVAPDVSLMWRPPHKLLKTWQLLASCEGGPSPSWQWHLNCPALTRWGRPPCHHTHRQTLNHIYFLLCWWKDKHNETVSFLFLHRCKLTHVLSALTSQRRTFTDSVPTPQTL